MESKRDEPVLYVIGSFLSHMGMLGAMATWPPSLADTPDDAPPDAPSFLVLCSLETEGEVNEKRPVEDEPELDEGIEGVIGPTGAGDGGTTGKRSELPNDGRYGVAGPADNPDPHIAREVGDGGTDCCQGPFAPHAGDRDTPLAPWGRDDSLGTDPSNARANMWAEKIENTAGVEATGMRGDGDETGAGEGQGFRVFITRGCHLP